MLTSVKEGKIFLDTTKIREKEFSSIRSKSENENKSLEYGKVKKKLCLKSRFLSKINKIFFRELRARATGRFLFIVQSSK